MDLQPIVFEISSEEEVGGGENEGTSDDGDSYEWLADVLEEVGRNSDDEVVVMSEVISNNQKFYPPLKDLDDSGDECVILDGDPDKPLEVRKGGGDDGVESDDLRVVSEKGQVACRDYPHPRHLCVKFPFSSTSHELKCDQCHCYACDSLAPCVYWGNGSSRTDHCHATDKEELWRLERQNKKNGSNFCPPVSKATDACPISANLGCVNIVDQTRIHRRGNIIQNNNFQPNLVIQSLNNTRCITIPRDRRHSGSNVGPFFPHATFKRTGRARVSQKANFRARQSIGSPITLQQHSNRAISGCSSNLNSLGSVPSQIQLYSPQNTNPISESPMHFQSVLNAQKNRCPLVEKTVSFQSHVTPQPNMATYFEDPIVLQIEGSSKLIGSGTAVDSVPSPLQTLVQSNSSVQQPNCLMPSQQPQMDNQSAPASYISQNASCHGNESHSDLDGSLPDFDFSWVVPTGGNHQQPPPASQNVQREDAPLLLDLDLLGLQCDNWIFENLTVEPGFDAFFLPA